MQGILRRGTVATVAFLLAAGAVATTPARAETGVGAGAFLGLGGHELDVGFVQVIQSALDSQFVGVEVALVRGHLVLSGYATPGVHAAVLAILANLLQNPVPVPVAIDVVSPNLGIPLPFLDLGAEVEIPDLGGLIALLGVADRLRIVR